MWCKLKVISVVTLINLFMAGTVSMATDTPKFDPQRHEFLQDVARLKALGEARDLKGLEELAPKLERKWFTTNKKYYGPIVLEICGNFSSWPFRDSRQYDLARQYIMLALDKSNKLEEKEKIPIEVELRLLLFLQGPYLKEVAKSKDWPNQRSAMAKLYFNAWHRLDKTIDENWDPKNFKSLVRPRPPAGVKTWISGMSPEDIKDPKLRALYKAALEQYRRKVERHNEQRRLRRLKKSFLPRLQKHLFRLYSGPLFDSKKLETKALHQDIAKHIKDKKVRAMILDGLTKRLFEESKPKPKEKPGGRYRLESRQPSK